MTLKLNHRTLSGVLDTIAASAFKHPDAGKTSCYVQVGEHINTSANKDDIIIIYSHDNKVPIHAVLLDNKGKVLVDSGSGKRDSFNPSDFSAVYEGREYKAMWAKRVSEFLDMYTKSSKPTFAEYLNRP